MGTGTLREAVIVAYGRSPIGRGNKGAFKSTHPVDYGAQVLNGVLKKIPQLNPLDIDDVIVGCSRPEAQQGSNMARILVQRAGLPDEVTGQTINRFCSSGLQAIAAASNAIMAGQADVIVAGGVESMSLVPGVRAPEVLNKWIRENRPGVYEAMGITAENCATKYNITREMQDAMGVESHAKAAAAQKAGKFDSEIIPITYVDDEGKEQVLSKDEGIREGTSMEGLAKLKPAFKEDGVVTAGSSSQVSDGAGFVVMMSKEKAASLGLKPIAKFIAFAVGGVDPNIMGMGPIVAVPKVMKISGLTLDDMDVIEINEAFAAQAIPCVDILKMNKAKVNMNGGALALGHPLGATGAILTCKAMSLLDEVKGKYALVTMCVGGGMGAAGIFEKL